MKIQYMSDLHLEFCDNSRCMKHNELPVTGDILEMGFSELSSGAHCTREP